MGDLRALCASLVLAAATVAGACDSGNGDSGDSDSETAAGGGTAKTGGYIALPSHFEGFLDWPSFERAPTRHATDQPAAPVTTYIRDFPPVGADRFPPGTLVVKAQRTSNDPTTWTIHAMSKRGNGFNAEGAVGWEWLELGLTADEHPVVIWRGSHPPDGDGYQLPDGFVTPQDCNGCHAESPETDFLLGAELQTLLSPPNDSARSPEAR